MGRVEIQYVVMRGYRGRRKRRRMAFSGILSIQGVDTGVLRLANHRYIFEQSWKPQLEYGLLVGLNR